VFVLEIELDLFEKVKTMFRNPQKNTDLIVNCDQNTTCPDNLICEDNTCKCGSGYEYDEDGLCVDVDECNKGGETRCENFGCENTIGSYTCDSSILGWNFIYYLCQHVRTV